MPNATAPKPGGGSDSSPFKILLALEASAQPYYFAAGSSGVVTETTDERETSSRKLSGGTRRCSESSLRATIVPLRPPLVTTLSPVLRLPKRLCHFFCFRLWE